MHNFHLSVGIFDFLFSPVSVRPKLEKMAKIEKMANFPTLVTQKSAKNENHKNSHTQMKIMHKMLLLAKNGPQWTIS